MLNAISSKMVPFVFTKAKIQFKEYSQVFSLISLVFILSQCKPGEVNPNNFNEILLGVDKIYGKTEYLNSPFVTSGDRIYMVGHQNGQFPDLGWHVPGEMGGIWDHPIKIMDGFVAELSSGGENYCLTEADTFINYPFANKHIFSIPSLELQVERCQFVPDQLEGIVIEYCIFNRGSEEKNIELDFTGHSDLRPVWLGERTGMEDGLDYSFLDMDSLKWVIKDSLNSWFAVFGANAKPVDFEAKGSICNYRPQGQGVNASLHYSLIIPSGSSQNIEFTIACSIHSLEEALKAYHFIQENSMELLKNKKLRYEEIAAKSRLTIPDKKMQQTFEWLKYNTDWLVRDVPGTGRGLSAGYPDYPWWFGADNEYALQGALAIGQFDLVLNTIDLIHKISEKTNRNGRIIHEVSTNGAVYNPGNINETPQFASLIWTVFKWTGDKDFLSKYYSTVKKGLNWILTHNDEDRDSLPEGFGMMEIHGLDSEMIDVASYTQKAFADASLMAEKIDEFDDSENFNKIANHLRKKINRDFWVPEYHSFADFIGNSREAIRLIKDAIIRADSLDKPWAVEELRTTKSSIIKNPSGQERGYVLHHNWVVNTPMETGVADFDKAIAALGTGSRFVNPFGMFVTGIDRDESAGTDDSSFAKEKKIFSYTGAVMTLPTGVQAVAENKYGNPDKALDYLKRMVRTFSYAHPGSMYEVSPDYGMIVQAWNIYGFAVPIVHQFFGIDPMASEKLIRIAPSMPSEWNRAKLENVRIGDNCLSISYEVSDISTRIVIEQTEENWTIQMAFPASKFKDWKVDGMDASPHLVEDQYVLEQNKMKFVLEFSPS